MGGKLCDTILSAKNDDGKWLLPGLHIYTMNTEKCTIELLTKCKIGFEDKKLEKLMGSELDRVLKEDRDKQLEKMRKQKEIEIALKATPVDEGVFKEVLSF